MHRNLQTISDSRGGAEPWDVASAVRNQQGGKYIETEFCVKKKRTDYVLKCVLKRTPECKKLQAESCVALPPLSSMYAGTFTLDFAGINLKNERTILRGVLRHVVAPSLPAFESGNVISEPDFRWPSCFWGIHDSCSFNCKAQAKNYFLRPVRF